MAHAVPLVRPVGMPVAAFPQGIPQHLQPRGDRAVVLWLVAQKREGRDRQGGVEGVQCPGQELVAAVFDRGPAHLLDLALRVEDLPLPRVEGTPGAVQPPQVVGVDLRQVVLQGRLPAEVAACEGPVVEVQQPAEKPQVVAFQRPPLFSIEENRLQDVHVVPGADLVAQGLPHSAAVGLGKGLVEPDRHRALVVQGPGDPDRRGVRAVRASHLVLVDDPDPGVPENLLALLEQAAVYRRPPELDPVEPPPGHGEGKEGGVGVRHVVPEAQLPLLLPGAAGQPAQGAAGGVLGQAGNGGMADSVVRRHQPFPARHRAVAKQVLQDRDQQVPVALSLRSLGEEHEEVLEEVDVREGYAVPDPAR